jgi:TPR repeat protein
LGCDQNFNLSFQYFLKSSDVPESCYSIAYMYELGLGVEKDFDKSVHYYTLSADKNYILSIYRFFFFFLIIKKGIY